jgi:hypothetical protein
MEIKIPPGHELPRDLVELIENIFNFRYPDLYDSLPDDRRTVGNIDSVMNQILDYLWGDEAEKGHRRLVVMGLSLGIASKPTITEWDPEDRESDTVLKAIREWLDVNKRPQLQNVFARYAGKTGSQAIDEAIDVYVNLSRICDMPQARSAMLEILDECLEGFALLIGSANRREILNWILTEVVPAAWCLQTSPPFNLHLRFATGSQAFQS